MRFINTIMNFPFKRIEIYKIYVPVLLVIYLLSGCSKDNDRPDLEQYTSYVNHELVLTYSSLGIKEIYQTLEAFYPEIAALTALVQYNVEVYNVTYKTMFQGEEIEASGLVCVPVSDGGNFPMISFQNGTNTAHANAPTKDLSNILFIYLHATSSTGCIMLIPDYIGFGKSEQIVHPYLHKESTVLSVENLIVAASEMMAADLINANWDDNLYLMGYSQGGWATLCTHRDISENSSLSFDVTASACGAGPYDLSVVQSFMFENITYPQPVYLAYSGVSYHELGLITNPLSDYFNEPFATELPSCFYGQFTNGEINEMLNDTVAVLISGSFLNGINTDSKYQGFRDAISNNSVHGWNSSEPIRLYHGTTDNYIPSSTSEQVYQEFIASGAENIVTYIPQPDLNHQTAVIPMALDALLWFMEMNQN